jgi:hypothetical protein
MKLRIIYKNFAFVNTASGIVNINFQTFWHRWKSLPKLTKSFVGHVLGLRNFRLPFCVCYLAPFSAYGKKGQFAIFYFFRLPPEC